MTMMTIENLTDHEDFIPQLAAWHHSQWANLNPGDTEEARTARYREELESDGLPITFVAVADGALLGSASLLESDMKTRMELTPWLASVYVADEHRRKGIGEALVRRVVEEAATLRYQTIYLFTPDKAHFYAKRGWTSLEKTTYHNEQIEIMNTHPAASRR